MFQFPGLYSCSLCVLLQMAPHCRCRVSPFGYPRFVACLRLPEAFRRLLRPSSALYAKTSAVRSSSFNHYISRDMFQRTVDCFSVSSTFFSLLFLNFTERPICLFCYSVFKDHPFEGLFRSLKTKQDIIQLSSLHIFLLRKEVIHPHVLVGIPCYDLTPIISPTFDGSLHCWLGHRLRVLPTLMV